MAASQKEPASSAMRFYEETAVWTAFEKVGPGFGLDCAFFSSILLLTDLGHRKMASAASAKARAEAGTTGRNFKAAIVYFARNIGTDPVHTGPDRRLKASGSTKGKIWKFAVPMLRAK